MLFFTVLLWGQKIPQREMYFQFSRKDFKKDVQTKENIDCGLER